MTPVRARLLTNVNGMVDVDVVGERDVLDLNPARGLATAGCALRVGKTGLGRNTGDRLSSLSIDVRLSYSMWVKSVAASLFSCSSASASMPGSSPSLLVPFSSLLPRCFVVAAILVASRTAQSHQLPTTNSLLRVPLAEELDDALVGDLLNVRRERGHFASVEFLGGVDGCTVENRSLMDGDGQACAASRESAARRREEQRRWGGSRRRGDAGRLAGALPGWSEDSQQQVKTRDQMSALATVSVITHVVDHVT